MSEYVYRVLLPDQKPEWCDVTSAGTFRIRAGELFDAHHHDCDEYWLVFEGRARVSVNGEQVHIGPGDIVCTPVGVTHDIEAVAGPLSMHWFETATPPGGRLGHLHRSDEQAAGHSVEELAATTLA